MRSRRAGVVLAICVAGCGDNGVPDSAPSPPDASGGAVDAGANDARAADASLADGGPAGARVIVSWVIFREGLFLGCDDFDADRVDVQLFANPGPGGAVHVAPCQTLIELPEPVAHGTYDASVVLYKETSPMAFMSVLFGRAPAPITIDGSEDPVHIPIVIELFDEPVPQLHELFDLIRAYHETNGTLPEDAQSQPVPQLATCCGMGGICEPDPTWWNDPAWQAIGFSIEDRGRFHYRYDRFSDTTFRVQADGDLDCDLVFRTYRFDGTVTATGEIVGDDMLIDNGIE